MVHNLFMSLNSRTLLGPFVCELELGEYRFYLPQDIIQRGVFVCQRSLLGFDRPGLFDDRKSLLEFAELLVEYFLSLLLIVLPLELHQFLQLLDRDIVSDGLINERHHLVTFLLDNQVLFLFRTCLWRLIYNFLLRHNLIL